MTDNLQHLHDQTDDDHKNDLGMGTAIFFLYAPKSKSEKMASVRSVSYLDAKSTLARTHGFKWIPYSIKSHQDILEDDCDGKTCDVKCPGSCYCSGGTCFSS